MTNERLINNVWIQELLNEEPFIDESWLRELTRFQYISIEGEVWEGEGFKEYSSSLIFFATDPNGLPKVIKADPRRWTFASYIRELPPRWIVAKDRDSRRLHRKLKRLIGDPMLDRIVKSYNDLYCELVDMLYAGFSIDMLNSHLFDEEQGKAMRFGFRAPGTISKLARLAGDSRSRAETVRWANQTLRLLEQVDVDQTLPDTLHANPIYVWGGAVLSGFLDEDLSTAITFVREHLRSLPTENKTFTMQGWALATLLSLLQHPSAQNFDTFYRAVLDE